MYDFIIVGSGVAGSFVSYYLKDYKTLLIDKNDFCKGASFAAGAFLSPLLGKTNPFKTLVNSSLVFAINFYKNKDYFINKGVLRIPKNDIDREKFKNYDYDFEYKIIDDGYFFDIGSLVNSYDVCLDLTKNIKKLLNYEVKTIEFKNDCWLINNEIKTKKLILTTGYNNILDEPFLDIRPIWGQRIDILTDTKTDFNYHKNCSISVAKKFKDKYIVSIGATHKRFVTNRDINLDDRQELLEKANDIIDINGEVIKEYAGVRSASRDYFPIVGDIINSKQTLYKYPYLKYGTKIPEELYVYYKNLYILNGLGGRGFVFAPYLAKELVNFIFTNKINKLIRPNRLFNRWVKKLS